MKKQLFSQVYQIAKEKLVVHPQSVYVHYSFIIQNNSIVGYGVNRDGTPPIHWGYKNRKDDPTYNPKLHSEINAYRKVKGILDKRKSFEIINVRLNRHGELRNSKPCSCCYNLLRELGCKKFYYSSDIGFLSDLA